MLYLIRHAEPLPYHLWQGDDASRPLSERGKAQAVQIGAMLAHSGATILRCAPHRRCVETAELIGSAIGLSAHVDTRLHIAKSFDFAEADQGSIWVAHSNNIPGALARAGVVCDACGHASVWKVSFHENGGVTAEYFEPDA